MSSTFGLVVALAAEARALLGPGRFRGEPWPQRSIRPGEDIEILCLLSGPGLARAEQTSRRLVELGADVLLGLGVSGGLDPALVPGELVLASAVWQARGGTAPALVWEAPAAHAEVLDDLRRAGIPARLGPVLSVDRPAARPEDKLRLHQSCGALVVDMESAAVAAVAREHALPFLCLRAVCDPQGRAIPAEFGEVLDESGGVRLLAVLGKLIKRPSLFRELLRMSRDFETALGALGRAFRLPVRQALPGILRRTRQNAAGPAE